MTIPTPTFDQHVIRGPRGPVVLDAAFESSLLVLGDRGSGGFGLTLDPVSIPLHDGRNRPVVVVRSSRSGVTHQRAGAAEPSS